jgi:hypothetical protein
MRREPGIGGRTFGDGVPLFEREHLEELPLLDAAEFAGAESGAVHPPDACRVRDADAPPQDCVWRGVGVGDCHGTDGATEFGDGRRDGIGATLHLQTELEAPGTSARRAAGPVVPTLRPSQASIVVESLPADRQRR